MYKTQAIVQYTTWNRKNMSPLLQFNNTEDYFRLLFIIQSFVCCLLFVGMFNFRELAYDNNIEVIPWTDLKYVIIGMIFIHYSKDIFQYYCQEYISKNLHPKFIGEIRILRIEKVVKWIYHAFYYTMTSFMVWYLFHEEPWYPTLMGGHKFTGFMQNYPHLTGNSYVTPFYMLQTASHLYALLHLVYKGTKYEKKYWEFMLHHSLATYLLFFSAMYNLVRYGIVVLAIHDLADIIVSSHSAYQDLKSNKIVAFIQFSIWQLLWGYTRLFIFPILIWNSVNDYIKHTEYWPSSRWAILYLATQMSTLLVMHIYWTYYIFRLAYNVFIMKRDPHNIKQLKN